MLQIKMSEKGVSLLGAPNRRHARQSAFWWFGSVKQLFEINSIFLCCSYSSFCVIDARLMQVDQTLKNTLRKFTVLSICKRWDWLDEIGAHLSD